MNILNPITVLHIPHSASFIPVEEREYILLSEKELAVELLRMTDWFTDELFISNSKENEVVCYPVSRLVLDPERFEDDSLEIMASRGMGIIYTKTSEGRTLRNVPDLNMRKKKIEQYYYPHHSQLLRRVESILSKNGKALVIDCHSFPSSPLPYELDQCKDRPDICVGTDPFHTPVWLTEFLKTSLIKRGFSVGINCPFSGALVPSKHFEKDASVAGIMIEINRGLYMNENTGNRLSNFNSIKQTACDVVSELTQVFSNNNP